MIKLDNESRVKCANVTIAEWTHTAMPAPSCHFVIRPRGDVRVRAAMLSGQPLSLLESATSCAEPGAWSVQHPRVGNERVIVNLVSSPHTATLKASTYLDIPEPDPEAPAPRAKIQTRMMTGGGGHRS